jgi:hypothetical protein
VGVELLSGCHAITPFSVTSDSFPTNIDQLPARR